MHLLTDFQWVLVAVFLISSMLSVGMQTTLGDFRTLAADRSLLLRSLLANFVIVPAIGIALAVYLPLERPVAGALALLACAPGGMSAVNFTTRVKGRGAFAAALGFLLTAAAIFISPLLMRLYVPRGVEIVVPTVRALGFFALLMLLPLCVGMWTLSFASNAAAKLSKLCAAVSIVSFFLFMVTTADLRRLAAGEIGWMAVGALFVLLFASMVVGWRLGGPARETRQMLATATGMRNAALCIAIVHSSAPQSAVLTPLVAFSLLMVPPNMLLTVYGAVRAKRAARRAGSE